MIRKEDVIAALKTIYDPEIPVNIYDLGLIYDITVSGTDVHVLMTLTTASCPAAAFMPEEVKTVLYELKTIDNVQVEIVYEPRWTRDRMSEEAKLSLGFV